MKNDNEDLSQIALTLIHHFDSLYYIDIASGNFCDYSPGDLFGKPVIPPHGQDIFYEARKNAFKCVHPDDLDLVISLFDKEAMLGRLSHNSSSSCVYRVILRGKIVHIRHFEIMCDDRRHIIWCLENIEDELRKKEQQEKDLLSARRMARMDALTGIRNRNAFTEFSADIDAKISSTPETCRFAVIMCDLNDLKVINDTRGHSLGDEAIQRTSRMICGIFAHSPVFRVGGDEFIVIMQGQDQDYDKRGKLLEKLREESLENKRLRTGPVVACGMAEFDSAADDSFEAVCKRADMEMYENKSKLKSMKIFDHILGMKNLDVPITVERKRLLDGMFGALYTIAGDGYVYLNDLKHDFSRWSLTFVDDFGMPSEYMYHADRYWQEHIHPDDMEAYREAMSEILCGNAEVRPLTYRARRADGSYAVCRTRGFILSDKEGRPEYFGGIVVTV